MMLALQISAIVAAVAVVYLAVIVTIALREADRRTSSILNSLKEVRKTFLESDESFRNLVNAMQDLENLQQIRLLAEQVADKLTNAHERIQSQLELSGKVTHELHELVALWSREGSELQRAYKALSGAVEKAMVVESQRATVLNAQLQEMLTAHSATGKA